MLTRLQARLQREAASAATPAQPDLPVQSIMVPSPAEDQPIPNNSLSFGVELEFVVLGQRGSAQLPVQDILEHAGVSWMEGDRFGFEHESDYLNSERAIKWQVMDDTSVMADLGPGNSDDLRTDYPWEAVELASPVMFGNRIDATDRQQLERICGGLRAGLSIQCPQSAGTHVHVGLGHTPPREGLSVPLRRRLLVTMYLIEETFIKLIMAPWRRTLNNKYFQPIRALADMWVNEVHEDQRKMRNRGQMIPVTPDRPYYDESLQGFLSQKILDTLSHENIRSLRMIWGMEESELNDCFGQGKANEDWRPLLYINEDLGTVEFRYLHSCLDPNVLYAYIDMCLKLVDLCRKACFKQENSARRQLRQLIFEVYTIFEYKGDDAFAERLLLRNLGLGKYQGVWYQEMEVAEEEMAGIRAEGYAPMLGPLDGYPGPDAMDFR